MKVTRVILSSNNNPVYSQFWNPISQVYAEKFGITPTLVWFGKEQDVQDLKLSRIHGEIIVQEPDLRYHIGWQSAWTIFYYMKFYPDDVFCTMGIDQIPLSPLLIRDIPSTVPDDTYLMLADDAYTPSHWAKPGGTSPTSFHIMKGSIANKVYSFEDTYYKELQKIFSSGIHAYYEEGGENWGLDESYSSHKLRQYADAGGKVDSKSIFKFICERRIECMRCNEPDYSESMLMSGGYGDAHLCRPFLVHKTYLEKMFKLIPRMI